MARKKWSAEYKRLRRIRRLADQALKEIRQHETDLKIEGASPKEIEQARLLLEAANRVVREVLLLTLDFKMRPMPDDSQRMLH